jgi:drug/metabolite transporter (DMT)-like permease
MVVISSFFIDTIESFSPRYSYTSILTSKSSRHHTFPQSYDQSSSILYSKQNPLDSSLYSKSKDFSPSFDMPKESTTDNEAISSTNLARTILIIVSALYGTNFGCVKILGESMDSSFAALLRFSLAALVFAPDIIAIIKSNPALIVGGLEVGLYNALGYYGQSQALLTSSASATAFICSLAVIVVPILDLLFKNDSNKKPWYESIIPALIAVIGVGCLELGGSQLPGVGDVWAFSQPLMFGLGFWRIEQHMKHMKGIKGEAQAFTGAMMLMVAAFSAFWTAGSFVFPYMEHPIAVLLNIVAQLSIVHSHWQIAAALLWTGIVTTAITSYGENVAMSKLSAAESTVIYSTEPIWGTAFAALTLHESIGWNTILGAALVISACMWSAIGPTVSLAGVMSSSSRSSMVDGWEEIMENMMVNWTELMSRLGLIPEV